MGRLIDEDSLKFTNFEIVMCEGDFKKAFKLLLDKIDNAPTVDAKPIRHGHWIDVGSDDSMWRCSVCKELQCCHGRYCSTCGAKMDEVEEC